MSNQPWEIDLTHSSVTFAVRHMVVSKVRGRFGRWTGSLALDTNDFTRSKVDVEIEAASIDTQLEQRDAHLRGADFLDAEAHPAIRFVSRRIEPAGGDRYRLIGDLTIRGTTREVALDVEHAGSAKDPWGADRAGFSATTRIDRSEFGLRWNMVLEAGGLVVGDRIDVTIEIEAVRKAAQAAA